LHTNARFVYMLLCNVTIGISIKEMCWNFLFLVFCTQVKIYACDRGWNRTRNLWFASLVPRCGHSERTSQTCIWKCF
jgi:hypothetical protein